MKMSNLLPDLVDKILLRVPATSLKPLQSTCKQWNDLFKDQRFTEKRLLRKASKQFLVVMFEENSFRSMSVNLHEIHNNLDHPSLRFKPNSSEQVKISKIFHCEGLLLCTTINHKLVVWNPFTGQTKWIQLSDSHISDFALGYENINKSCNNYKILRHCDSCQGVGEFEIYEFSSDSWRVIDVNINPYNLRGEKVSLKGNTYSIAFGEEQDDDILRSFDFSTERYKRLNLPRADYCETVVGLTVVREEQLVVLQKIRYGYDLPAQFWVTTNAKIDETTKDLTWSKFLAVHPLYFQGLDSISFVIDDDKKMAVCCDLYNTVYIVEEDKVGIYAGDSPKPSHLPFLFNYVPSLVQITQATVLPRSKRRLRKRKHRN